ncbi:hypothetical protein FHX64_001056 [Microbacter margulisiae]|uniref:Uncharacterized protein n=1 Tax=Microbacter margulisiae TaxID=1350067 RepID=A0A7W5DQI9_9PORP|nr:hypothetical protein [Microbacter margulisiae]
MRNCTQLCLPPNFLTFLISSRFIFSSVRMDEHYFLFFVLGIKGGFVKFVPSKAVDNTSQENRITNPPKS